MPDTAPAVAVHTARARWRAAEDRLYPALLADPASYQRSLAAVQAVVTVLRTRTADVSDLVTSEAAPAELLAAACLAGPPAPADLLVAAACGMRDRELTAQQGARRHEDAVAVARAAGAAWAVLEGPPDVAELTEGRRVALHLASMIVVEAAVDPWSPDHLFAVTVTPGESYSFVDRAGWLAGVADACAEIERGPGGQRVRAAAERGVRSGQQCRLVGDSAGIAIHHDIRRAVFVTEQHVFDGTDADAHDTAPSTLHVLGLVDGVPAGTVRLYPLDDSGCWQGDRLAVLPPFRAAGLGAPLVQFAVATAAARGGRRMIAHVQPANEVFFRRLGWTRRGAPELYVGIPHVLMDIALVLNIP